MGSDSVRDPIAASDSYEGIAICRGGSSCEISSSVTPSTRTNEPMGEDVCAREVYGEDKKGISDRLGTWSRMIG